ncbi:hypothetical protein [Micromonospora globbae]|uniref:hypothetical protein n=1 Tax=Micromonospora globbae TaxID=1894969 RepID=UPI0037AC5EB1
MEFAVAEAEGRTFGPIRSSIREHELFQEVLDKVGVEEACLLSNSGERVDRLFW